MVLNYVPFAIIAITAAASVVVELLSWLLVYRTTNYKRIVSDIESVHRKFTIINSGPQTDKDIPKKKKKLEADLMVLTREFSFKIRGVTGVLSFVLLFVLYRLVTWQFKGIVIGKLPFYAPQFMHRLTHSGLEGEDFLECSAMFIYVLCGLAVRTNITKFMGLGPSRSVIYTASPAFLMKAMDHAS